MAVVLTYYFWHTLVCLFISSFSLIYFLMRPFLVYVFRILDVYVFHLHILSDGLSIRYAYALGAHGNAIDNIPSKHLFQGSAFE